MWNVEFSSLAPGKIRLSAAVDKSVMSRAIWPPSKSRKNIPPRRICSLFSPSERLRDFQSGSFSSSARYALSPSAPFTGYLPALGRKLRRYLYGPEILSATATPTRAVV